jgi:hypothetical protein
VLERSCAREQQIGVACTVKTTKLHSVPLATEPGISLIILTLTPPDYFLWGYLKGRVCQNKPQTIDALKANITEEIQAVTADVLARTFQNMARRVQSCMDANGGHFQHTL